jgi:lariat debranching enzyme
MRIAIEGCTHGELEKIYSTIQDIEKREGYKVHVEYSDILIDCGLIYTVGSSDF